MMIDIYLKCTSQDNLIADLKALDCGLVFQDENGIEMLAQASHKHALNYIGRIVKTQAQGTFEGEPPVFKETSPAVFHDGEHCNIRCLDEELAAKIQTANFTNGTEIVTPSTPSVVWA